MTEVGTLKELGVGVGDVVECVSRNGMNARLGEVFTVNEQGDIHDVIKHGVTNFSRFKIISRATPKLWRDMTPEEKGALLLAAHDGKSIECHCNNNGWVTIYPSWDSDLAYRIKPEPKVETEIITILNVDGVIIGKGTVTTYNGKPDCASVKMEAIK